MSQPRVMLSLWNGEDDSVLLPVGLVLLQTEGPQVVAHLLQVTSLTAEGQGWPPFLRCGHTELSRAAAEIQNPLPGLGETVHDGSLEIMGALKRNMFIY